MTGTYQAGAPCITGGKLKMKNRFLREFLILAAILAAKVTPSRLSQLTVSVRQ